MTQYNCNSENLTLRRVERDGVTMETVTDDWLCGMLDVVYHYPYVPGRCVPLSRTLCTTCIYIGKFSFISDVIPFLSELISLYFRCFSFRFRCLSIFYLFRCCSFYFVSKTISLNISYVCQFISENKQCPFCSNAIFI